MRVREAVGYRGDIYKYDVDAFFKDCCLRASEALNYVEENRDNIHQVD